MLSAGSRTLVAALPAALASAVLAWSCYTPPPLDGPYRCTDNQTCPAPYTCDDGVCCIAGPGGVPECPSYVGADGKCSDGGTPRAYWQDLDEDGFGADGTQRLLCQAPATWHFALDGGDCNDDPAAAGAAIHPGAVEVCDGLDNNCNGQRDEGFPLQTFWRDQDLDGFGDPAGAISACTMPAGYVTNNADCEPDKNFAHPGGTEVCNGVDDDCNGTVDDYAGSGAACTDPTRKGVCQAGVWGCNGTAKACVQTVQPSRDICDTLDNNCDGVADERPTCGGPTSLAIDPGMVVGAKKLAVTWFANYIALGDYPTRCLRDDPVDTGAPNDTVDQPTAYWQGGRATTHVYWAQAPAGTTWDLSASGKSLRLLGIEAIGSANQGVTDVWAPTPQPWIMLCAGSAGFIRLARTTSLFDLLNGNAMSFDETFPVVGNSLWTIQAGSSSNVAAVLRQVEHVEVLVEPQPANGGSSFAVDFSETRMGFP